MGNTASYIPVVLADRLDLVCNAPFFSIGSTPVDMKGAHIRFSDWYRAGSLAPYMRSSHMPVDTVHMFESAQPAGDFSGPGTADLVVIQNLLGGSTVTGDVGAGRFCERVMPGQFLVEPPYVDGKIVLDAKHAIRAFCISPSLLKPVLENARPNASAFDFGPLHSKMTHSSFITGLLNRLWSEAVCADSVGKMFAEGGSICLALALLREADLISTNEVAQPRLSPRDRRVRRCIEILDARLGEDMGLTDLAKAVDLSSAQLTSLFSRATGLPPHRWLVKRRVERACQLLIGSKQSITEIASSCGFASSQHLAAVFRKQMGVTPSQYRCDRST